MLVVGIESSCDETAVALVEDGHRVRSSVVSSQVEIHKRFGGVVPEVAARAHLEALSHVWDEALQEVSIKDIDAIAITQGPGLIGALLVGMSFAKGLSQSSGVPLIPVNHVHAHIYGANLAPQSLAFPCLALVVSGGHTNLYLMRHSLDFQLLASSIDDACGESFDKVARLLGLGYPGGPIVEKKAREGNPSHVPMPQIMKHSGKLEFSYSGLKTHMLRQIQNPKNIYSKEDLCAAFQEEALGQMVRGIHSTCQKYPDVKHLVIAGGVAANQRFRDMLEPLGLELIAPELKYCSDNAAMIAALGSEQFAQGQYNTGDLEPFARYPYEEFLV